MSTELSSLDMVNAWRRQPRMQARQRAIAGLVGHHFFYGGTRNSANLMKHQTELEPRFKAALAKGIILAGRYSSTCCALLLLCRSRNELASWRRGYRAVCCHAVIPEHVEAASGIMIESTVAGACRRSISIAKTVVGFAGHFDSRSLPIEEIQAVERNC